MLIRYVLLLAGIALVFDGGDALARSTFSARFAQSAIAGPEVEQTAVLYLHYFAGDGEATVAAQIEYIDTDMDIRAVRSQRGVAHLQPSRIEIDYGRDPLAGESVDTLYIDLRTARSTGTVSWSLAMFSSAGEGIAHQKMLALKLVRAPETAWRIEPQRLYQGERSDVTIYIDHSDSADRSLEQIQWRWPEQIRPAGDIAAIKPLSAGERTAYSLSVRVDREAVGPIEIAADARVGEMALAPLKAAVVHVDPLPKVEVAAELMQVGRSGAIACTWRNEGTAPISLDGLRLQIHAAFSDIVLEEGPPGVRLAVDGDRRYVLVDKLLMEVGSEFKVVLRATPLRPGPFTWQAGARPQGRGEFIPLTGDLAVGVAWGKAQRPVVEGKPLATDLELMGAAFVEALEGQLDALPIGENASLYLQAGDKSSANWLVEDALLKTLRERGYRLLVRPPASGEEVGIIHYRLASSRVVYSSSGGSWLPFVGNEKKREAYGDLVLRLETRPDGLVRWERRVRAYGRDVVPSGSADILGGGAMLERATIEAENKKVERGLSASILGGLVYIFFIL